MKETKAGKCKRFNQIAGELSNLWTEVLVSFFPAHCRHTKAYGISFNLFNLHQEEPHDSRLLAAALAEGWKFRRKYDVLMDWLSNFGQIWSMNGPTKWQPSIRPTALCTLWSLALLLAPHSQSVTEFAWWHYNLPKLRHNAPHQFNLVSKPD